MTDPVCKAFRQLLLSAGYVNVRFSRKKVAHGRIQYGSYVVSAFEPLSRSPLSVTLTLADMKHYLANTHIPLPD